MKNTVEVAPSYDRNHVLLANAIDYIHEMTGYEEKAIAIELLGMREEEWKEIAHLWAEGE